jgi:hypothetical protein
LVEVSGRVLEEVAAAAAAAAAAEAEDLLSGSFAVELGHTADREGQCMTALAAVAGNPLTGLV